MPIGYGVLEYSHKTYFSENALLPGLVKVEFNMEHVARQYLEDLRYGNLLCILSRIYFTVPKK